MGGVDGVDHRQLRGPEILRVSASFRNGPALGQLPDVSWSLSARQETTAELGWRSGSLRQEASWGVGGGVWEVPLDLGPTGWPARPRLTGWKAIWSGGVPAGLWVQRWTLQPEGGSPPRAAAACGPLQIVGHEVEVARCQGEVLAGRVVVEVRLLGEVYASGRDGGVRCHPLSAEASLLLDVPEARVGDTWRAGAEVAQAVWRPALDGSVSLAAVVRLRWRLLREEVVPWPPEAKASPVPRPGRYLLSRIAAEGEATLPVQTRVVQPPEDLGMSDVDTRSANELPYEVQRVPMEPLALGALLSGGDFQIALLLNPAGQPALGARSALAGWRWARSLGPDSQHRYADNRQRASLLALEWEGEAPDLQGQAASTVTLARALRL